MIPSTNTKCASAMPSFVKFNSSFLVAAIVVNGIIWERIAEGLTDYQLKHGHFPDNLLQQYYRGSEDLREIAQNKQTNSSAALVLFDPYDEMSGGFYIRVMGGPEVQAIGVNFINDELKEKLANLPVRKLAVARNAEQANDFFKQAGFPSAGMPKELFQTASGRRAVFQR